MRYGAQYSASVRCEVVYNGRSLWGVQGYLIPHAIIRLNLGASDVVCQMAKLVAGEVRTITCCSSMQFYTGS